MAPDQRGGRPRASSRETLAEAASELFLEKGFAETSVADITTRAGVSRSSFFNYFATKSDVLWAGFDERVAGLDAALDRDGGDVDAVVRRALRDLLDGFDPDTLALALAQSDTMGLADEIERESAVRRARIARAVAERLVAGGVDPLRAEVLGAAHGGAVLAALSRWAGSGAGRTPLGAILSQALEAVAPAGGGGAVRQLRVVVRADDYEAAVAFYRDVVGMPERAAYEGDGDARVTILEAGVATLELANAAQVAMIDRVETDGDAPSDSIRLALEVSHAAEATERLVAGGAALQASPRTTPWGSRNSRLRAPADLQVTLFEEGAVSE
ncbi:TetR family transcriptional regulator [Microbacterium sp. AG1240]|uniref:TetR family transcriptional regulator n=1 Tax=Microbacterium sp. AG1240 TaxID=2183992 RepID=UPI000EB0064C|nr:TetR family transcriptional regulator [Microbacterium sp. AG1240]RKT36705.1 TetR family transcriptional regulator [Microbacterium sp. AG1240]